MDKVIKVILLMNNQILISQIEEISTELGEPDCRLIEPFLLNQSSLTLSPWLMDYTSENKYMISSRLNGLHLSNITLATSTPTSILCQSGGILPWLCPCTWIEPWTLKFHDSIG